MKLRFAGWLSLPGLLLAPAMARAQEGPAPVFRTDTQLVVVHATVLDSNGKLVTNLPKSAFHLSENGVGQQLKIFRREDSPVSIGLIIDDSGSMIPKRGEVAAAGVGFVRASNPDDEAFVMHFNEKAYLDTDFTHDLARIKQGLTNWDSRGTTAMRDALRLAIEHLDRQAREDKKVLLLVTDGEDNSSSISRDYIVKMAQQDGVLIYAIGILQEDNDPRVQAARRELEALAQATGGQAYFLKDAGEIDRTAGDIARTIRSQYTLAYTPSNQAQDGTYRRIEVRVDMPQPLLVRTRTGYWAGGTAEARVKSQP